jgi:hypothetical protein
MSDTCLLLANENHAGMLNVCLYNKTHACDSMLVIRLLEAHAAGHLNMLQRNDGEDITESSLFAMKTRNLSSILPSRGRSTMQIFINGARILDGKGTVLQ